MASIDAFLELADGEFDLPPRTRASQRFFPPPQARGERDPAAIRERRWIIAFVVLVDVVLLLALRWAMQVTPAARRVDDRPQLVFIDLPRALPPPPPAPLPAVASRRTQVPMPPTLVRPAPPPRQDLQAVRVPTAPSGPVSSLSVDATGYTPFGRVPAPATAPPPRDLLAHRSTAGLLPGGDRPYRAALPVQASKLDKAVRAIQALTGGGPYDPCPDLRAQMADINDPDAVERTEQHYEQACSGQ